MDQLRSISNTIDRREYLVILHVCQSTIFIYIYIYFNKFILFYLFLFLAVLGLHCCTRAFSSYGDRGLLFVAVHRLFIVVASLVVEHGL